MPGNPKSSPWYKRPRGERKKGVEILLSDEGHAKLAELAAGVGDSKSKVVEALVQEADAKDVERAVAEVVVVRDQAAKRSKRPKRRVKGLAKAGTPKTRAKLAKAS